MKSSIGVVVSCCLLSAIASAQNAIDGPSKPGPVQGPVNEQSERVQANRAEARFDEMLGKMQEAIEEIAELYGNPQFLEVFTNDRSRADELKQKLSAAGTTANIKSELANLEKRRQELLNDVALKERECAQATAKLAREREALDAVATALDQARRAVEGTVK